MNARKIKKYITDCREPFFLVVKKYINQESRILDVGSGDGIFARTINRDDVYMFDGNKDTVEKLKQKYVNCKYSKLPYLPYEDNYFDLIHSSHLVEHLTPQELYEFMVECDRCLKNEGYLIISAPMLWAEFYDDLSHLKPYNPKLFEKYLGWGVECCCTRPLISKNYKTREILYRYSALPYHDNEVFIYSEIVNKIFLLFKKIKYLIGFRRLEVSGFTLVLQKESN